MDIVRIVERVYVHWLSYVCASSREYVQVQLAKLRPRSRSVPVPASSIVFFIFLHKETFEDLPTPLAWVPVSVPHGTRYLQSKQKMILRSSSSVQLESVRCSNTISPLLPEYFYFELNVHLSLFLKQTSYAKALATTTIRLFKIINYKRLIFLW